MTIREKVDHCKIWLQDNLLRTSEGVQALVNLTELNISKNLLAALGPISSLTQLTQLSVEDNHLSTLKPVTALCHLIELYAGTPSSSTNAYCLMLSRTVVSIWCLFYTLVLRLMVFDRTHS